MARLLFRQSAKHYPAMRRLAWWLEALCLDGFWLVSKRLRPERASAMGAWLFRHIGPRLRKNRHVLNNLSIALRSRDSGALTATAGEVWASLGSVLAEYPHLAQFAGASDTFIQLHIDPGTRAILQDGAPAIYVTSHMANWELAALSTVSLGVPLSVIYSPQSNPYIDRRIQAHRKSLGCNFIHKQNALRNLVRELRAGRSIGLLSDVRIDEGEAVEFFGIEALTATTPAWLGLKLGCPVIPIQIGRLDHARYRVSFHAPLSVDAKQTGADRASVLALTRSLNQVFEDWILQQPGQWMCTKRRWPKHAYAEAAVDPESRVQAS